MHSGRGDSKHSTQNPAEPKESLLLRKFIFSCSLAKLDLAFLAQGAPG